MTTIKRNAAIILIIIAVFAGCFYLYYENTKLQVSSYHITSSKIPDDFNNYKIVQISDFHNTKSKSLTGDLVREIEAQRPGIIVFTGDLIDSRKTDTDTAVNFVKRIGSIAPIYYVSGNHEASTKDYSEFKEQLEENQVVVLDNKTETITINGAEINLIGINDPKMAHEEAVPDSEIIKTELNIAEYDTNNYCILLSHRPETIEVYSEKKLDLVLTGHAHGGQIRIPFLGGIAAPGQGFFPKYTSGIFRENNTVMAVSRGIGNSIFPFRINNRPELVVITLNNR